MDLVLGPDRLSRRSPIDEHDFYLGRYLHKSDDGAGANDSQVEAAIATDPVTAEAEAEAEAETHDSAAIGDQSPSAHEGTEQTSPRIYIEVTIIGLSDEQRARFRDYIEWWDRDKQEFYSSPPVEGMDQPNIVESLRVTFIGQYDVDEDDFEGTTYFARSLEESDTPQQFLRRDKRYCGFLFLRGLRTGRRALSLEHGSLLDIILRLKEIRPQMWEATIDALKKFVVASDPEHGISGVLESIDASLSRYVPKEWGLQPHLRVSSLTREHLRHVITAFIPTGPESHFAPYYRQGAGTINMLVLAMLSLIAEDKQNVIFAMEEPETAVPPYAQKRIVHEVRKLSAQSLFTSHSPYTLEEFDPVDTMVLTRSTDGILSQAAITLPESVKPKRYRREFRTRFCEGLLSRRILVAEGTTEATAMVAVARRLAELMPTKYSSLEALGVCTVDAGSDSQIADLASVYRSLGKTVYAVCDKQETDQENAIRAEVDELFMHEEANLEELVLKNTTSAAKERFADELTWPQHIRQKYPDPRSDVDAALKEYFMWTKGNYGIADFLAQCDEQEVPEWFRDVCKALRRAVIPPLAPVVEGAKSGDDQVALENGGEASSADTA